MTYDWARPAATALRMLTKFGRDVTRRSYTAGTYNTATGTTTPTTADTTRKAADFAIGASVTTIRGELVQVRDRQMFVDATATLELQDHIIAGGVEYTIVSMDPIGPAGTAVVYDCHIRAA